jgi:hypothetical protein
MDHPTRRRRLPTVARPSRAGAAAVFIGAGILAALGTAWFQRICATRVSLDEAGAFDALLAVAGGVAVLGLGLQVVVGRLPDGATVPPQVSIAVGVTVGALVAVGMPIGGWYAVSVGLLMAAITVATMCSVAPRARLLLGAGWTRLAVVVLVDAVVRLAVIAPLFAVIGHRLTAVLAATAAAEAATAAGAYVLAPRRNAATRDRALDPLELRRLCIAVLVLSGLGGLTLLDSVIARLRLPAGQADAYSLGTTVARASFFMALLLTQLALPTLMRERGRSSRAHDVLVTAAAAIVVVSTTVALAVIAWPTWMATTVLGRDAAAVDVATMRLLAAAWAAMSVVPLLTCFHVERHRRLAFTPFAGAVVLVALGVAVHTAAALALIALVVFSACALSMGLAALQRVAPVTRAVPWVPGPVTTAGAPAEIAMVVPFYNPGPAALIDTVRRLVHTLDGVGTSYRVLAVSDGCTDGSDVALADQAIAHVELIGLPANLGKGAAVRAGLAHLDPDDGPTLVGYIDADGDIPPEQLAEMVRIAGVSGADAVVASKRHPDSVLEVTRHRTLMSAVFRGLTRLLFRLDVRDTQTGLKLYRGETIAAVGPLLREDGFAIDVEILVAARRERSLSIVEAPVTIVASHSTTVSWRRGVATIAGLGRIFWRSHVALLYDPSAVPTPVAS